jgi:uncharacterized membrane protein YjjP (DUF1212 family)
MTTHATPSSTRASADRSEAGAVLDSVLWAGQLLMEHGAEAERVEETIRACGTGLGVEPSEILVSYGSVMVTYESGGELRTKIRCASPKSVNMKLIESISHLTHQVEAGRVELAEFRTALERIRDSPRHYGPLLTAVIAGVGCGAFCRIFDGNWAAFAATCVAASIGTWTRGVVLRRNLNTFFSALLSAALSSTIVLILHALFVLDTPSAALSACVLTLVPGVPLITAAADLVKGHIAVGMARATEAGLVILFAGVGALLAMRLMDRLVP